MRKSAWILLVGLLGGCASGPDYEGTCAEISTFATPPETEDLYRAVITRIDDNNVVTKASYRLSPGKHRLRVVELIDDPRLGVKLRNRRYHDFEVELAPHTRYHIGAQFNADQRFRGHDAKYWQPVVWKQTQKQCEFD
ncbi:hypothetical protein [Ferrimonas aestuarii]|uniref:Lipoprotein n=1 Tax=Ferrimonas aestuarii TaxID=2569539 RepID=A0A4U1BNV4_9GAMM|nr:hypothetical protein [Ferrimonas aestuarii]TKB55460.1 hypothetical protein FCL42_09745 [Ferrimonas aestuarii]